MTAQIPATVAIPADPALPARSSSLATTRLLVGMLARPTLADRASWLLPVAALGVASALGLSVAGGARFFFTLDAGDMQGLYEFLALFALILLAVPLATLAMAATRLATTRRDTRLSSLRLLGASARMLRLLTLVETAATATAGVLSGFLGYLVLMPLLGLLPFAGRRIGVDGMWLGVGPVLAAMVGIVALAVASSALGLRKVAISPLGVRLRQKPENAGWWRLALGAAALVAVVVLGMAMRRATEVVVIVGMAAVIIGLPLVVVDLVGPFVIRLFAHVEQSLARTAPALLAARAMAEDPKQLWRQVASVGMASFVAVFVGSAMAMSSSLGSSNPAEAMLAADMRTGVFVTLAITFATVACSLAINQTAAVLDRRGLYVGLDMLGMPTDRIDGARRRAVLRPMLAVVALGVGTALVPVVVLGIAARALAPEGIVVSLSVVAVGLLTVWAALRVSGPALRQVLRAGLSRAE